MKIITTRFDTGEAVRNFSIITILAFAGYFVATSDLTTYGKVKVVAAIAIFATLALMRFTRQKKIEVKPQHDPFFEQVRHPKP